MRLMDGLRQLMEYDNIHKKIKDTRKLKKITIQDLSRKTGLTQGYLSKIENSPKPPPIPTLVKIAYGLNVHISYFFEDDELSSRPSIIRAGERKEIIGDYTGMGYRYEAIIGGRDSAAIKPLIITLPTEMEPEEVPCNAHDGQEMIYVLEGQLFFFWGDENHLLATGDSTFFDAAIPHKIVCSEKKKFTRVLSVLSL